LQKQHKNYILYSLLLLYLLIIIKQRYGKAEQQSFRAAEVCTRSPLDKVPLQSYSRPPLDEAPLHSCSMPPSDEALLHSCSMPPFGRGPSTLLLHALYRTRPLLQELFCSRSSLLQNQQLYMLKRHCKQTIITYQHMKLSCNIQLEL
jgi:hypothetical protein